MQLKQPRRLQRWVSGKSANRYLVHCVEIDTYLYVYFDEEPRDIRQHAVKNYETHAWVASRRILQGVPACGVGDGCGGRGGEVVGRGSRGKGGVGGIVPWEARCSVRPAVRFATDPHLSDTTCRVLIITHSQTTKH